MVPYIRFFYEIGRLKTLHRRGWLIRGVKHPETVAQHSFRVLILSWLFGKGKGLNIRKVLKIALVHSLSAVYIDYISSYDELLQAKSKKELVKKYPALLLRAPIREKGKIMKKRYEDEERAVKKLIGGLPDTTKSEILYLWQDFQNRTSKEAKFIWMIDKLENLVQALEYRDKLDKGLIKPFLLQIKEITEDKQILEFVANLNKYFEDGELAVRKTRDRNLIKFILEIGKLKSTPRRGWLLRGVRDPETVADHSFRSALMAWLFSTRRKYDQEVAIIVAATHDVYAAEIGDVTYYDEVLKNVRSKEQKKKIVESLPWLGSKKQKAYMANKRFESEVKAVNKLLKLIPHSLRHELKYFWLEYKTGASREGKFLAQVDRIEALLQAIQYQTQDKEVPIKSFWLQMKGLISDPLLVEFVEAVDEAYFGKDGKKLFS